MSRLWRIIFGFMRMVKARLKGVKISPLAFVGQGCQFEGPNYVDRFCNLQKTSMGRFSYIGHGSFAYGARIGRFCSIAGGVKIGLATHPIDQVSMSPVFFSGQNVFGRNWAKGGNLVVEHKAVEIGHDVWIGTNAIIMGGISVGNGAIVAAGAVVTRDVEPFTIVGGVPAKFIRKRFSDELTRGLEATHWWDADESTLANWAPEFQDPARFVQGHPF